MIKETKKDNLIPETPKEKRIYLIKTYLALSLVLMSMLFIPLDPLARLMILVYLFCIGLGNVILFIYFDDNGCWRGVFMGSSLYWCFLTVFYMAGVVEGMGFFLKK